MVAVFLAGAGLASVGLIVTSAQQPPDEQPGTHGRHMEHRFDDPERYARSFDGPARDEWQMPGRVIAALNVAAGEAVADIGAGTGYFTLRLAEQTPARAVYAVDIEPAIHVPPHPQPRRLLHGAAGSPGTGSEARDRRLSERVAGRRPA